MKKPKVALVHDYLVQYGGAEKTLEAISEIFPDAPIYTSIYNPRNFSQKINSKTIITPKTSGQIFKWLPILSKYFTFLIPLIFENFDLSGYDIVISDSSSYAKGVITKPDQLHISYIHTPPRFLYKYSVENTKRNAWFYKPIVLVVDHYLRMWDFISSQRADFIACNSNEIKKRIMKFYNRKATVIYPPVEICKENIDRDGHENNFYLIAGRLAAYKNFDLVIKAFNELDDFKLFVIGTGSEEKYLKSIANNNITFLGRVSDEEKNKYMSNCLGLINSVDNEDFGIVPVEVMAHGKPVLAHGSAGHLETVIDNVTGMYFYEISVENIKNKIVEFDQNIKNGKYEPKIIRENAQRFSKDTFKKTFKEFVFEKWNELCQSYQK